MSQHSENETHNTEIASYNRTFRAALPVVILCVVVFVCLVVFAVSTSPAPIPVF